jgi:molybdenum-dependent DNA-binding transcriptional regulator ModE
MDNVANTQQSAFDKLIEAVGSIKGICNAIGVKYVTAYAWKMRNGIPKKWHKAIIEASEGRMNESQLG